MEKTYCNVMDTIGLTDHQKAEIFRNCTDKVRVKSVPRRLVKVAIAVCVTIVLACTTVAAVNEQKRTTWKDVYDSYESVIEETEKEYGFELKLPEFTNMRLLISVEDFRERVKQHCADIQTVMQRLPSEGESVKKISYTIVHPSAIDVVFITFYGTLDICQNEDQTYSAASESFGVMTRATKGIVGYASVGNPEVEQTEPNLYVVKQQFSLLNRGWYESTVILRVAFRIDPLTGDVYMSEWQE